MEIKFRGLSPNDGAPPSGVVAVILKLMISMAIVKLSTYALCMNATHRGFVV